MTKVEDDVDEEEKDITLEETQEILEDGTVVKVTKIKSTHKHDGNVAWTLFY